MGEKFLGYVYKSKCEFQEEANRTATAEIERGVRDMIEFISTRLKENCPEFEIADIIPTGSFYEGTKIGAPDEFDFMLTLAKLSGPDKVTLHPQCSVWYPCIKLNAGVEFPQKFKVNIFYNGEPSKEKEFLGNPKTIVREFWKEIKKVTGNMRESRFKLNLPRGTMSVDLSESKKLQFYYKHNVDTTQGSSSSRGEAGIFPVESLKVGIDLMLAIEHSSVESVLKLPGFPNTFENKNLLLKHRCHVIPKSCHTDHAAHKHCWFVTFSCMERERIKHMDDHHKKCYKILKSLLCSEITMTGKSMNLSSYTLKTAFLFHVYGATDENGCSDSSSLSVCICHVLDYLASNLYHLRMPCFFARDMNTWGNILETPRFIWNVSENLKQSRHAFELCWVKLMFKYVNYLKRIISVEMPHFTKYWDNITYFKDAVGNIMQHYSTPTTVFKLEGELGTLESCTDEFFNDYVKNLKAFHKVNFYFIL